MIGRIDRPRCGYLKNDGNLCRGVTNGGPCRAHNDRSDFVPKLCPCPKCKKAKPLTRSGMCAECSRLEAIRVEVRKAQREKAQAKRGTVGDDARAAKVIAESIRFAREVREECGL